MVRQLASFNDIEFTYNENGIRTSKTVNGVKTTFCLDGTSIIEQTDGTTTLHFFYDSNNEVIGFKLNNNNYFYLKNTTYDIAGIVDSSGNLITTYEYDPWGKVISISGDTVIGELNPFRYRSYYYDSDIEMYYLQSRYYDPEVGRFINSDDVSYIGVTGSEISYNPFAYCENNPVNNLDYFGCIPTIPTIIAGALIGGLLSAVLEMITQRLLEGKTLKKLDWKSIGIEFVAGALTGALIACGLPDKSTTLGRGIIGMLASLAHSIKQGKFKTISSAFKAIGQAVLSGAATIIIGTINARLGRTMNYKTVAEMIKKVSFNRIIRGGIRFTVQVARIKLKIYLN